MTAQEMGNEFCEQNQLSASACSWQAWAFGGAPDLLAQLVLAGVKTATASAAPLYQLENEPFPQEGEYSVILDSAGEAVCIIQTTCVYTVPFCQGSPEHAFKEGEEDRSLESWQKIHRDFFSNVMAEAGLSFSETMPVVCEEFRLVHPPVPCDSRLSRILQFSL